MEQVFDQLTKEVRTLLFEISCYLKKSKVDVGQNEELARRYSSAVDTDLRKEILGIKGVYGAGTIYGQFEVHVDSDADIPLVEAEMCRMMRQKNHFRQYIVRSVERKTKPFALCHGKEMVCQPRMGTLGGFVDGVDGSNRHLYGLTCAHVVNGQGEGRYEVFIREESNNQLLLFARSYPNLTISSGDVPNPLIDLAAVRVVDGVKNECIKYLKDENSEFKPGRVAADVDLEGHFVYKYGAKTHFTKGRVCSTDYCLNNNLNYIVLVENYGGVGYFAQEGDSGAMICMPDENEVYIVKAIGILTGGDLALGTDTRTKYASFRLHDGLDKLTGKAGGIQFTFPNNFM
ncbi:uncharacterized protein LOC128554736 isoform X1 [Mercenaria mercenaria]|uniref:uncharacterized protein LOC128554736 isoform X1 n=1 Tax=Mercenaria mercenaria TaxID=6596 RepID=UPI00234F3EA7|nr:uncharacterized protein LOC128554736 isoform X1 [Mercenaria mercenaria]XP_053392023.1 uncharacterized protein LOC128554736 isoform X1 [Mercenaria mercenaria]XP_053392025.1 uncharacterized protein LOC128554736 isoform X1 [Mercenaria mercenaria]